MYLDLSVKIVHTKLIVERRSIVKEVQMNNLDNQIKDTENKLRMLQGQKSKLIQQKKCGENADKLRVKAEKEFWKFIETKSKYVKEYKEIAGEVKDSVREMFNQVYARFYDSQYYNENDILDVVEENLKDFEQVTKAYGLLVTILKDWKSQLEKKNKEFRRED
jgi:hypothetical protein